MNVLLVQECPSKVADKWIPRLLDAVELPGISNVYLFDKAFREKPTVKQIKEAMDSFAEKLFNEISCVQTDKPADLIICMGNSATDAVFRYFTKKGAKALKHCRNRVFEFDGVKVCCTYSLRILSIEPKMYAPILGDFKWIFGKREVDIVPLAYSTEQIPEIKTGEIGLDFETDGVNPYDRAKSIITGACATAPGRGYGWTFHHPEGVYNRSAEAYVKGLVESPDVTLVGQDIKFDLKWALAKCKPRSFDCKMWDTRIAHSLLDENSPDNSLKSLASIHTDLGHYGDKVDRKSTATEPLVNVLEYNTKDSDAGVRLKGLFLPAIKEQGLEPLCDLLMNSVKVLTKIEHTGMYVDRTWATSSGLEVYKDLQESKEAFFQLAGTEVNFDAPHQIADVLFNKLKIPILTISRKTGLPSTSKDALLTLKYKHVATPRQAEGIKLLEGIRKGGKLWGTYYVTLPERLRYDGRIRTTYSIGKGVSADDEEHGTVTGRLSSSDPNLQNIPIGSRTRGMFAATPGWKFAGADYSQLELRIAALLSQDPVMMAIFEAGLDIHTSVLSDLKGKSYAWLSEIFASEGDWPDKKEYEEWYALRVAIKRINFGILYGIGPGKLSRLLLSMGVVMPEQEIRTLMQQWLDKYKGVARWILETEENVLHTGQVVMPTGRIRRLVGASRSNPVGLRILRQGVNSPIQSVASDMCLTAMNYLDDAFGYSRTFEPQARLILQVHDMIGLEFNPAFYSDDAIKTIIKKNMTEKVVTDWKDRFGYKVNVPIGVGIKISERWA